jgi:hypothetical protein
MVARDRAQRRRGQREQNGAEISRLVLSPQREQSRVATRGWGEGAERDSGYVAHRRPIRFLGIESQRTRRPNSLRIFIMGRAGGGPTRSGPSVSPAWRAGRERCACETCAGQNRNETPALRPDIVNVNDVNIQSIQNQATFQSRNCSQPPIWKQPIFSVTHPVPTPPSRSRPPPMLSSAKWLSTSIHRRSSQG